MIVFVFLIMVTSLITDVFIIKNNPHYRLISLQKISKNINHSYKINMINKMLSFL